MADEKKNTPDVSQPADKQDPVETQNPAESQEPGLESTPLEFWENLSNAFKDANVDKLFELEKLDDYVQEHKRAKKAPQAQEMDKWCETLGVKRQDMHAIVSYMQKYHDPDLYGPEEKKLMTRLAKHQPQGQISPELASDWDKKVEEASKSLSALQAAWADANAVKANCAAAMHQCQAEIDQQKEQHRNDKKEHVELISEIKELRKQSSALFDEKQKLENLTERNEEQEAKLQEYKQLHEQKVAEIADKEKLSNALQGLIDTQGEALDTLNEKIKNDRESLIKAETELKKKTFELNAVMLVCAFSEQAAMLPQKAAVLDSKNQEAKDIKEEVFQLAAKYRDRDLEYGNGGPIKKALLAKAEEMQFSGNSLVRGVGAFIVDKEHDRVRSVFSQSLESEINKLNKGIKQEKAVGKGLIVAIHKFQKAAMDIKIKDHIKDAKSALFKVNSIEKKIQQAKDRAEDLAIIKLKQTIAQNPQSQLAQDLAGKKENALKKTQAYKDIYIELEKSRIAGLEKQRDRYLDKFKEHYRDAQTVIHKREDRQKDLQKSLVQIQGTIKVLKESGHVKSGFEFKQADSFEKDLQKLLNKNARDLHSFMPHKELEKSTRNLARDAIHEVDTEFDRSR